MKPRPIDIVDDGERALVRVPLGRSGLKFAEIWRDDWDFVLKLGASPNWNCVGEHGHVTVCARGASGNHIAVGRILLDAGPGETVRYLDGNKFNLRRENLRLVSSGWACRRDRDYLREREAASFALPQSEIL